MKSHPLIFCKKIEDTLAIVYTHVEDVNIEEDVMTIKESKKNNKIKREGSTKRGHLEVIG